MSATTVVHLIGSLDRGGAESVALDLCRRIPAGEVQQVFLCLSGRVGILAPSFETTGAIVEAMNIRSPIEAARLVRAAVQRYRPDAVVSHVSLASGWLLTAAWTAGARIRIARLHSVGDGRGNGFGRRAYRVVSRLLMVGFATRIVAVSRSSLEFGLGRWAPFIRQGRSFVLGNGVDTERFAPSVEVRSEGEPRVIHVGRGSPEKNRAALVPIFLALERTIRTRWWIVGPGDTADLGTLPGDRFEVLGDRSDVPSLLGRSDVLVLPSLREGLPGVILEALSTGVPVVASELETLRELATALPGIRLVSPHAAPEVWADAIAEVIALAHRDAEGLRSAVVDSDFAIERSVRDWRHLFGAR
ncbi:glycosyltransferase [Agromyces sp. NPDC056965]|uniref:glycosyltransferase n=1 Tax=Agromyces sp. NPDC056965 TaxID=3345983 RepID=UPI003639C1DD